MTDLTNLTHEQLRRMVELLHESGQRMLDAYGLLHGGALIDSHGPMRVGIDLRTDAERIGHEPRETDPTAKSLADRKTVEEWAVVETDEIDPDTRAVTHGRRRGAEYHWSPFGHYVNLTEDHRKRVELSARGDTADLAYAAAAEWVRGQG